LFIQRSEYSAILSKYIPTDRFFRDFVHWVMSSFFTILSKVL